MRFSSTSDVFWDLTSDVFPKRNLSTDYSNFSTSTIKDTSLNAFSFATSTTATPFLSFDTKNYRIGIGTTSPNTFRVGQCVTGDTKLRRRRKRKKKNGEDDYEYDEIEIKDIMPGDEVLSLNEKTARLEWQQVLALYDMGEKPVYQLTTASGKEIRTTANHPYLTKYGWVPVGDLREGDEISIPKAEVLARFSGNESLVVPDRAEKRNYNRSGNYKLDSIRVHALFSLFANNKPNHQKQCDNAGADVKSEQIHFVNWLILITSSLYAAIFAIIKNPAVIIRPTMKVVDGNSGTLVLGTNMPITSEPNTIFAESKAKSVTMRGRISDFINTYYQTANNDVNWDKIISIKYVGVEQVWDISVKNTHNFIANGLLAHNTAFIVDSSCNVGTGTTTPNSLLSIAATTPKVRVQDTASSGDAANAVLEFYDADFVRKGWVGDGSGSDANITISSGVGNIAIQGTGGQCTLTGAASGGTCFSD